MTEREYSAGKTQYALQLVGPGQLSLNSHKEIFQPGPRQILIKVEAVGLCFSDLKLLKQFSAHPRKAEIVSGVERAVLDQCPSYVPGDKPTVPGHEVCCRIVAVGKDVTRFQVGERCLVQTDYRFLPTRGSNAAFGYSFEGGLQEYVLTDERINIEPASGERFLIPVPESLSASAVALVEPWACVEDAYAHVDRKTILRGGRLLVVADSGHQVVGLSEAAKASAGMPSVTAIVAEPSQRARIEELGFPIQFLDGTDSLEHEGYDDIIYFGASKETIEALNDKLAAFGMINIVLGGRTIGRPVSVGVGRVHYGFTRWIGTTGISCADSYSTIPVSGELRPKDSVLVVGAAGPMGQMHVIRALSSPIEGLSVVGADVDDVRLESLRRKAEPIAKRNGVPLRLVNTAKEPLKARFSNQQMLVPSGALVAAAIVSSAEGGLIDIFAGIPAPVRHDLDLDTYIARRCYMFGTSGSNIRDMKIMLERVTSGQLDTNWSVDAISGMAGAADGIAAVENRTMAGKVVVYPMLHDVELIALSQLGDRFPTVAAKLDNGQWCRAAEQELLRAVLGEREPA